MFRVVSISCSTLVAVLYITLTADGIMAQDRQARIVMEQDTDQWREGTFTGSTPAQQLVAGCRGTTSEVPHFILEVQLDGWVGISLDPGEVRGAMLMLRGEGQSLCQDNADDLDTYPEIRAFLTTGEYYVHVGRLDGQGREEFRLNVRAGPSAAFTEIRRDRTQQFNGISGGEAQAGARLEGCPGVIATSPNHVLHLSRPMYLDLKAQSASDLTLLVVTSEETRCNDDSVGTLDPQISGWFPRGYVQVYVGSHNPRVQAPYTLVVTPLVSRHGGGRRHHKTGPDTD